jgi:hypothetical protein
MRGYLASMIAERASRKLRSFTLTFQLIDPREDTDWDEQVMLHPKATVFHGSHWARVLTRSYGQTPLYLRVKTGSELVTLLPLNEVVSRFTGRRGVSLPFADECEPLWFQEAKAEEVMAYLRELGNVRRWKYLELRGGAKPALGAKASVVFSGHQLRIAQSPARQFASFTKSVQRAIRKGEGSGVIVETSTSVKAIRQYYNLHRQTRRRHGAPPQPYSFFEHLREEMMTKGLGFVVLAFAGAHPIAGAVFLQAGRKGLYKFGASDERFQELRGNNLVMWEGIKTLAAAAHVTLDFGRTSVGNAGLRRFKLGWGATESTIRYYRLAPATGEWLLGHDRADSWPARVFSKLPLAVNELAGRILYAHLD